jgi:predicted transcriptional regulator
MKRTTVFLDETLERDLQAIARQEKRPVAALVREALAAYVANREPATAPALSFVGAGASGRSDIAERHEDLLWRKERVSRKIALPRGRVGKAPRKRR